MYIYCNSNLQVLTAFSSVHVVWANLKCTYGYTRKYVHCYCKSVWYPVIICSHNTVSNITHPMIVVLKVTHNVCTARSLSEYGDHTDNSLFTWTPGNESTKIIHVSLSLPRLYLKGHASGRCY